eukprot:evm.model.scf_12EXC.4 EVM.evm.TU.scf_12EXC.4   scf_12EXC:41255-44984(+)
MRGDTAVSACSTTYQEQLRHCRAQFDDLASQHALTVQILKGKDEEIEMLLHAQGEANRTVAALQGQVVQLNHKLSRWVNHVADCEDKIYQLENILADVRERSAYDLRSARWELEKAKEAQFMADSLRDKAQRTLEAIGSSVSAAVHKAVRDKEKIPGSSANSSPQSCVERLIAHVYRQESILGSIEATLDGSEENHTTKEGKEE